MKLKLLVCVMIVAILLPTMSFAEPLDVIMQNTRLVQTCAGEVAPCSQSPDTPLYGYTSCYVPVTYKTVVGNTVTDEVTYYEKVADIEYKYYVTINSLDKCTGGSIVASQNWPKVTNASAAHLDLSISRTEYPTGYVIPTNNGNGYRVNIYGGCLTITYNAVIYKDITNQTIGEESVTVTRAYSYTATGSVADLLP